MWEEHKKIASFAKDRTTFEFLKASGGLYPSLIKDYTPRSWWTSGISGRYLLIMTCKLVARPQTIRPRQTSSASVDAETFVRICAADKVTRRRTDNCGSRSCHLERLVSRDLEWRIEAEDVCQFTVTGWITAQSPGKPKLCSSSRRGATSNVDNGQILLTERLFSLIFRSKHPERIETIDGRPP